MEETPKKIIDGDLRCFICNSTSPQNERIRVFGKSSVDIQYLIKTAADIDVGIFSSGNDLFICKTCYNRLVRFAKVKKNLEGLKEEIKNDFKKAGRIRVKRLRRASEESTLTTSTRKQCNAAKSLNFHPPTTCTSFNNAGLLRQPFQQKPYQLVYSAFPMSRCRVSHLSSPVVDSCFAPLTSTPIRATKPASIRATEPFAVNTKVTLSVDYPSKKVNKTLQTDYEALGKALVHGPPQRIAKAVMKCKPIASLVIQNVLHALSNEVSGLCSRKTPSLLRKTGKNDLLN